jgi:copper transport protein
LPLFLSTFGRKQEARLALERFSSAALPAVILLMLSGAVLAVVQVETLEALTETSYGHLLAAKLVLVLVALAIAVINRCWLTALVGLGHPRPIRRTLAIDILVMAGILSVVAGWRLTPPPRAIHAADAIGISAHIHTAGVMADVTVHPGRRGPNTASFVLMTGDFGPLNAREVTVSLIDPVGRIGPASAVAALGADARWQVGALSVPVAGRYKLRFDIVNVDLTRTAVEGELDFKN